MNLVKLYDLTFWGGGMIIVLCENRGPTLVETESSREAMLFRGPEKAQPYMRHKGGIHHDEVTDLVKHLHEVAIIDHYWM